MFNLKLVREDLSNEEEVKQLSLSCVFISKEFKLSKVLIEDGLRDALKKSIIERFFF